MIYYSIINLILQRIHLRVTQLTVKCNSKLLVYDGGSVSDPLIMEVCDIDKVNATSTGNNMLVQIHDVGVYLYKFVSHYVSIGMYVEDRTLFLKQLDYSIELNRNSRLK